MKKLTADVARRDISHLKAFQKQPNIGLSLREETYLQALEIALPILEQQERGDGGWIEWGGGECPVAPWEAVSVKHRNDKCTSPDGPAYQFDWSNYPSKFDTDIIAYRIIPERAINQNGEQ